MASVRIVLRAVCFSLLSGAATTADAATFELVPDADGNFMRTGGLGLRNVNAMTGDIVTFSLPNRSDNVVEVKSGDLTASELCNDPNLPLRARHRVVAQDPLPASLYPPNELSGPYRAFPTGIYALSPLTDECGYVERTTPCTAGQEDEISHLPNPTTGGTEYLCQPKLSSASCVRGAVMDRTWQDPAVQGVFLRLDWDALNLAYDSYDFAPLKRELVKALKYGKSVTLGIRVGENNVPPWVFTTGIPGTGPAIMVTLGDFPTGDLSGAGTTAKIAACAERHYVASPNDTVFRALFTRMIDALGTELRKDQRHFSVISGIKITGMGMETLENRFPTRCNVGYTFTADGDVAPAGHLIDVESSSLGNYSKDPDTDDVTVTDIRNCICNPAVLRDAGYTPDSVYSLYNEIETAIQRNFGYKQMIYMNISGGFPRIGEVADGHRFFGDHLYPFGAPENPAFPVAAGAYPGGDEQATMLIENGRFGRWRTGTDDLAIAPGFGTEHAALDRISIDFYVERGAAPQSCSQQQPIVTDSNSLFYLSPQFPIPNWPGPSPNVPGCPNVLATREGIEWGKVTGFQTKNGIQTNAEVDSALWNAAANTNGVFVELYEWAIWGAKHGGVLDATPSIRMTDLARDPNAGQAIAKSLADWNALFIARGQHFATLHPSNFLADPYPASFSITVAPSPPRDVRYYFNARACQGYLTNGTPVRINHVRMN